MRILEKHKIGGLQHLPLTLTLKIDAKEMNYPSVTTDASGYFTVDVSTLVTGTYSWRVKGPDGVGRILVPHPKNGGKLPHLPYCNSLASGS